MNTRLQALRSCPITTDNRKKSGFSLAELMVVIVILGLLATLVVPKVFDSLKRAFGGKVKADIMAISGALDNYAINNAKYPDSLEDLVMPDENGYTFLNQKSIPKDPWGMEYQYEPPLQGQPSARVFTLGADSAPGGIGDNADISNISLLGGEDN
jgi:general secretion pathway protein G